jgi:hypothetical protein
MNKHGTTGLNPKLPLTLVHPKSMNSTSKYWSSICLKMISILCFIGVFIAFMRLDEEEMKLKRFQTKGVISQAVVTDKKEDELVRQGRKGKSSKRAINVVTVRHNPKSTVTYADYGKKVQESDLPPPLPDGKDAPIGIMWVSDEFYDATKIGDVFTVINTPYEPNAPALLSDLALFSPKPFQQAMGICGVLGVLFWLVARRMAKRSQNV